MANLDSERAAIVRAEEAREELVYALLRGDEAAASAARAAIDAAHDKIAKSRRTRLGPLIASVLDEAAVGSNDPVAAALAGGRIWDELVADWQSGRLATWLTSQELQAVEADLSALRVVLAARARGEDFTAVMQRHEAVRARDGFVLAARTSSKAEARKVSALIEQTETRRTT